jgi:hypothetical protein
MMGWPADLIDLTDITARKAGSLVGEGLHLGCLALIVYAAFLTETAPWWDPAVALAMIADPPQELPPTTTGDVKRRRRLGGIVARPSMT